MCSPEKEMEVSVHAIERFAQRRLKIPDLDIRSFFVPLGTNSPALLITIRAQENYLRRMFAEEKIDEALAAFDRFYKETRIICISTISLLIRGILKSDKTVLLNEKAELYLKTYHSCNPKFEEGAKYFRFDDMIFVVIGKRIVTCLALEPFQRDLLDSLMYNKAIEPF